jgi:thiamine kinase-like enzyme
MVEELSSDSHIRLNQALAAWRDWRVSPASEPVLVSRLGGHTNESYRVSDSVNDWVIRLNSTKPDGGINRGNELLAIEAAHSIDIAPGIVYQNRDLLILPFLHGNSPGLKDLPAIGRLFSKIHSLEVEAESINLHNHLLSYGQATRQDADITHCLTKFHKLESPGQALNVLCHQDLTMDNLIKGGLKKDSLVEDSKIYVIDWEYAHHSDPAYDLAVFSYTSRLNQVQKTILLNNYAREEKNLPERIQYYELFYGMLEILWWHNRNHKDEKQIRVLDQLLDQALSG